MTVEIVHNQPSSPGIGLTQKSVCEPAIEASASPGDDGGGSRANEAAARRTEASCWSSRRLSFAQMMLVRAEGPQRWYISTALGAWSKWLTKLELDDK